MENLDKNKYISTPELAKMLGISHVAVYKKVKAGSIKARKVGRNYLIDRDQVPELLEKELSNRLKKQIDATVKKIVHQYGEALRMLGRE